MKTYYKILVSFTAIALLFLTSCLDDEKVGIDVPDFAGTPYLVDFNELPNSQGYIKKGLVALTNPTETVSFKLRLNLSSPYTLDKDLTLTLAADEAYVNSYIADALADVPTSNDGWELLDASYYTLASTSATIAAGSREVEIEVNVATGNIQISDSMLIAIAITDVSDGAAISGNFGTALVYVGVKNAFEGYYNLVNHWIYGGNGQDYGPQNSNFKISTMTASKVTCAYAYPYWPYYFEFEIDVSVTNTIDGHSTHPITVVLVDGAGVPRATQHQIDDYSGENWNYVYKNADDLWVIRISHSYTSGSGEHICYQVYTQNPE